MKKLSVLICTLLLAGTLCLLSACSAAPTTQENTPAGTPTHSTNPIVEFVFNTGDVITVELYPDEAPITVANFLTYVREGFYRGTVIHRVEDYVVQGGGFVIKNNTYTSKTATHDAIKGEFSTNGVANNVSHTAGAISMARTTNPDSATSQFFFCPVDYTYWDGKYAAFGHVVNESSLAAIKKFSQFPVLDNSTYPAQAIIITAARVVE